MTRGIDDNSKHIQDVALSRSFFCTGGIGVGLFFKDLCAPGGIRTPNNRFEACRDIHFTTGAVLFNNKCGQGESNSRLVLGKDVFYH